MRVHQLGNALGLFAGGAEFFRTGIAAGAGVVAIDKDKDAGGLKDKP